VRGQGARKPVRFREPGNLEASEGPGSQETSEVQGARKPASKPVWCQGDMKPVMGQVASNRARVYGALKPVRGSDDGLGRQKGSDDGLGRQKGSDGPGI